jgi:Zn-dependent protease with chaperone function
MQETLEPPTSPPKTPVEQAWAARQVVDPAELDEAHLGRYRHPSELQALLTIGAIIVGLELVLFLLGPDRREAIRASLHWTPRGVEDTIMKVVRPGGVVGTVLIFLLGTAVLDVYSLWLQRVGILSEATEVTPATFPQLYPIVEELRKRFALPTTRVFVQRTATTSSSQGLRPPYFIVIPPTWLGMLTPEELRFVLGHEMGHIKLGHTRVAPFLGGGGNLGGLGILSVLLKVRSLILSSYQRAQELSGDRIGVVASRGVGPAVSAAIKAGIGTAKGGQLDHETLAGQAAEVHHGSLGLAGRLRQFSKAQPSLFFRLKELITWAGLPPEKPPASPGPAAAPAAQPQPPSPHSDPPQKPTAADSTVTAAPTVATKPPGAGEQQPPAPAP